MVQGFYHDKFFKKSRWYTRRDIQAYPHGKFKFDFGFGHRWWRHGGEDHEFTNKYFPNIGDGTSSNIQMTVADVDEDDDDLDLE